MPIASERNYYNSNSVWLHIMFKYARLTNNSSFISFLLIYFCFNFIWLDGLESVENRVRPVVDVRDVAEALLLAYKKPEAEGRYICTSYVINVQSLVKMLKGLYPNYNYPKR